MPPSQRPITVVLADDHAAVRQGVRAILESNGDISVVAEATDGNRALELIQTYQPDVAVLDVRMPGRSGLEVLQAVREAGWPARVLIITALDDAPYMRAALQLGADGYLLKTAEAAELVDAVRSVVAGQPTLDPKMGRHLLATLERPAWARGIPRHPLTPRESEILQLASRGLSNEAIGSALGVSRSTIQYHLAHICVKLRATRRTDAVLRGARLGLVTVMPEGARSNEL